MAEKIRWGILGAGRIAGTMAEGLKLVPDAELVAVGSRTQANADAFGDKFNIKRRHGSYEALAADPDVDVVYVATPHPMHKDNTIMCLRNGKAVLCEKPFTINAREAREVIEVARRENVFVMEAMWTRFIPSVARVRRFVMNGGIGPVRMIKADFGFRAGLDPKGRLFNLELGGGALLDIGVYTISLVSMFLGPPSRVTGMAHIGETGVDEEAAMMLSYDNGALGVLGCAVRTQLPNEAWIIGTEGMIKLDAPFWASTKASLMAPGKDNLSVDFPLNGNGFNYEAAAVVECLRRGEKECADMPLGETVTILETMDKVREQWGLKYPME